MDIKPYTSTYKDRCLKVFESNVPEYFAEFEYDEFKTWLDSADPEMYWVIFDKDKIVGCGGIFIDDDKREGGFAWGMIDRSYHGKGFGTALSKFRIDMLKSKTDYPLRLCTSQFTVGFYEKLGFVQYAYQKDGFTKGLDRYDLRLMQ